MNSPFFNPYILPGLEVLTPPEAVTTALVSLAAAALSRCRARLPRVDSGHWGATASASCGDVKRDR